MINFPNGISARELFWLWYDRLSLEEKKEAAQDFYRFVAHPEIEASLQKILLTQTTATYNEGWSDTCSF